MRTVLSLFDGMSCGQIALIENGQKFERYYASEIDKKAIAQTQLNFPKTIQLGDVERWREWDIDWSQVDLILAGSPCQGFSSIGQKRAFDDPRSKLYWVFLDILKHVQSVNPKVKFLLENVRMSLENMSVITNSLGVYPIEINAARVSVQERIRFYWSNIRTRYNETFGMYEVSIPQPRDTGVVVSDIWEENVPDNCYLIRIENPSVKPSEQTALALIHKIPRATNCHITARGYRPFVNDERKRGIAEYGTVVFPNQKVCTILRKHAPKIVDPHGVRKLTRKELSRAQSVPDWYVWDCTSQTQLELLGNGWNVAVIQHILSYL